MNIALISREYPPFFGGGIGAYTERFARALAGAGHRPVVVTVSGDGEERTEETGGVTVVRLPFVSEGDWSGPHPRIATPGAVAAFHAFHPVAVFAMQVARALPDLCRRHAIDAIEAPDTGALAWFLLNDRRTGEPRSEGLPPVVTTVHSPTEWIARWNRSPLRGRAAHELARMEREQALWSDGLVCPSGALADWAAEHWDIPRERIAHIPYALGELEAAARRAAEGGMQAAGEQPAGGGAGEPGPARIVYTGRLEPRKGVDTLLAAFAELGPGAELDLIGEDMPDPERPGPVRFGADAAARLVPAERRGAVRIRGRVPPAEVGAAVAGAAVVAVPAPMDNFPLTCVEAMAHGRVIVAAAAGGMAEMIRDGREGLLFAPGDAAGCAAALRRALSLPAEERRAIGRAAATRILDLCGNEVVVARRVEHLRGVIEAGRRTAAVASAPEPPLIVNAEALGPADGERLAGALRTDIDFAHGWTSHDGLVRAFSTPSLASLASSPRALGPLALSARAAADPRIAPLLRGAGGDAKSDPGRAETESAWGLAAALCAAGYRGAVVPSVVVGVAPSAEEAAELASLRARIAHLERSLRALAHEEKAAREELDRIKGSRGWALLQRVYAVLHILRGRGFASRPVYHRGEEAGPGPGPRGRNQTA